MAHRPSYCALINRLSNQDLFNEEAKVALSHKKYEFIELSAQTAY